MNYICFTLLEEFFTLKALAKNSLVLAFRGSISISSLLSDEASYPPKSPFLFNAEGFVSEKTFPANDVRIPGLPKNNVHWDLE